MKKHAHLLYSAVGLAALFLALVFSQSFRYERRIEGAQHRTVDLLELTSLLTRSLSSEEIAVAVLGRGRRLLAARGGVGVEL